MWIDVNIGDGAPNGIVAVVIKKLSQKFTSKRDIRLNFKLDVNEFFFLDYSRVFSLLL